MIDVSILNSAGYHENMVLISALIAWLTKSLKDNKEYQDILLEGFVCYYDNMNRVSTLLLCEGESQKGILEILKQPPGEFKDRYVACVANIEPTPVVEKKSGGAVELCKIDTDKKEDEKEEEEKIPP